MLSTAETKTHEKHISIGRTSGAYLIAETMIEYGSIDMQRKKSKSVHFDELDEATLK